VPRGQTTAASGMSFQRYSNSSIGHIMGNPYSSGDVFTYSAQSVNVNDKDYTSGDRMMLKVDNLPEHFANITVGQSPEPPVCSYYAHRLRDASCQTVNVNMVNAGTGHSSVLLVDASTNTPRYDKTGGLQRVLVNTETDVDIQTDHETKLNASHPTAANVPSRWADCWHQGQSPGSVEIEDDEKANYMFLFSDANKNLTSSVTDFGTSHASKHESSSFLVEDFNQMHDTVPKTSQLNGCQMHSSCDCEFANCPFASPTSSLGVNRRVLQQQSADISSNFLAASHESGHKIFQVNALIILTCLNSLFCVTCLDGVNVIYL